MWHFPSFFTHYVIALLTKVKFSTLHCRKDQKPSSKWPYVLFMIYRNTISFQVSNLLSNFSEEIIVKNIRIWIFAPKIFFVILFFFIFQDDVWLKRKKEKWRFAYLGLFWAYLVHLGLMWVWLFHKQDNTIWIF